MEESLRPHHAVPTTSDPDAYAPRTNELTRTHSGPSELTMDTSKDISQYVSPLPLSKSIKWTEQRHREYLNSLESSFANQLHQSLLLHGRQSQNNSRVRRERQLPDQYLVLQDGCCQKISFQRNEPMLESTADSHVIAGSPLKHHVKTFENGCLMRESDAYELGLLCDVHLARSVKSIGGSTCSEKHKGHICCLDVARISRAEVTDQNFEEDNLGNKSKAKRSKTSSYDSSSDYQVVLSGDFHGTKVLWGTYTSSEFEGQHDLPSENLEHRIFLKSDELHFLQRT